MENIILSAAVVIIVLSLLILIKLSAMSRDKTNLQPLQTEILAVKEDAITVLAKQDFLSKSIDSSLGRLQQQIMDSSLSTEQKLENMRRTLFDSINRMQEDNGKQMENIRQTVDEKLQTTLEKKLNDSFQMVSERLEQVYKGLGEMQTLAVGVGDLKKVLSNVKTRGILGEIQLGAILEQLLSAEQYGKNIATKKGSAAVVEYAIKLPGDDGAPVWLPVDAKFPVDAYSQLLEAYDSASQAQVDIALKALKDRIRGFAKDIHTKYIDPPNTTDFAIMFLPVEGLYAEVVRAGMVEILQREYKVSIAGPTTMGALLNSLQMGFRTLAIQKRSSEVWNVLSSVKAEFDTFATVLEATQRRITQANDELDKLVGVRTRQIQSKLKSVHSVSEEIPKISEETV